MTRRLSQAPRLRYAALALIACYVCQAHDYRAKIQGMVTDSSQGAISGVTLILLNAGTGVIATKTQLLALNS
jgi:hypothetical protein